MALTFIIDEIKALVSKIKRRIELRKMRKRDPFIY